MARPIPAVTRAQYKLGVQASRRLGRWLASWEERGRQAREGKAPEPTGSSRRSQS